MGIRASISSRVQHFVSSSRFTCSPQRISFHIPSSRRLLRTTSSQHTYYFISFMFQEINYTRHILSSSRFPSSSRLLRLGTSISRTIVANLFCIWEIIYVVTFHSDLLGLTPAIPWAFPLHVVIAVNLFYAFEEINCVQRNFISSWLILIPAIVRHSELLSFTSSLFIRHTSFTPTMVRPFQGFGFHFIWESAISNGTRYFFVISFVVNFVSSHFHLSISFHIVEHFISFWRAAISNGREYLFFTHFNISFRHRVSQLRNSIYAAVFQDFGVPSLTGGLFRPFLVLSRASRRLITCCCAFRSSHSLSHSSFTVSSCSLPSSSSLVSSSALCLCLCCFCFCFVCLRCFLLCFAKNILPSSSRRVNEI